MHMVADEFNFPRISGTSPNFTTSSSLWHASRRLILPNNCYNGGLTGREEEGGDSFKKAETDAASEEAEERMDMLWEDFNNVDYLQSSRSFYHPKKKITPDRLSISSEWGDYDYYDRAIRDRMADIRSVHPLKMSRISSGLLSPRRLSMVKAVNVLKKFMIFQKPMKEPVNLCRS